MKSAILLIMLCLTAPFSDAMAFDIDWSGQFRSEAHWVKNYSLDTSDQGLISDPARNAAGGYYIPGGGQHDAQFQTLFLKLRPKLIVNDNIYIKSEWWVGNPIYGFYGDSQPSTPDQRMYYSNQSRGSFITAQRVWAEFLTDVGTVQVGRAPLSWGLGLVWNSGDGIWDRYESTGDVIRLVSKFGAFSVIPGVTKYTLGTSLGGSAPNSVVGGAGVSDYSIAIKYENPDDEFEGGVNFIRRLGGAAQEPVSNAGYLGTNGAVAGLNYNTWDIFARKNFGKFSLAGELPITTGDIGGIDYKTYAVALEGKWNMSDIWDSSVKVGHAPGQPSSNGTNDRFKAFFFNPNYQIALIMFRYQLANFASPQTQNNPTTSAASLRSPYDNPIVNANYLSLTGGLHTEKWRFFTTWTWATANEAAAAGQSQFYNTWQRKYVTNNAGDQSKSLGFEVDLGTTFNWDDTFQFRWDLGWFIPGDFYRFSNTAAGNAKGSVFATVVGAGISF